MTRCVIARPCTSTHIKDHSGIVTLSIAHFTNQNIKDLNVRTYHKRRCRLTFSPKPSVVSSRLGVVGTLTIATAVSSDNDGSNEEFGPTFNDIDLNILQTALNNAIASEKYELAAQIRDVLSVALNSNDDTIDTYNAVYDWHNLGIIDWLADRAEDLGYRLPTEVQRRSAPVILDGKDCIIEAVTGSGKTLAFLLPMLSLLKYPPEVYPDDLHGPAGLVIVPTRELGVQAVMLIYKLFGGSVNPGIPGERGNMFRYHGPRGLKVKGLLMEDEVEMAVKDRYIAGAHVVVGTPDLIAQALERGVEVAQHCNVLVVDEVDACSSSHPREMNLIFDAAINGMWTSTNRGAPKSAEQTKNYSYKPEVVLVGATLDDKFVEMAVERGWVQDPVLVNVGRRMQVPSGLQHRYILSDPSSKIGAMSRQLRADLKASGPDAPPARVMLFAENEQQARSLSDPLRTVLWGDHAISVLLPGGMEPIKALHSFRDNQTSLLLATPAAARGLDLPAVSHVYNVGLPVDAADYLHRAGRAGRIGSPVRGLVTTMVTSIEEEAALMSIAKELHIEIVREEALPPPALLGNEEEIDDVDEAKRALEAMLAFSPDNDDNDTLDEV